jgi:hypothetical protein
LSKPHHPVIRELLKKHPDGLTVNEICSFTGIRDSNILRSLKSMPDVYIDRWLVAKQQKREQAVWVAVKVPENCPRPERKLNARPTKLRSVEQPELGRLLYGFVHQNAGTTSGY